VFPTLLLCTAWPAESTSASLDLVDSTEVELDQRPATVDAAAGFMVDAAVGSFGEKPRHPTTLSARPTNVVGPTPAVVDAKQPLTVSELSPSNFDFVFPCKFEVPCSLARCSYMCAVDVWLFVCSFAYAGRSRFLASMGLLRSRSRHRSMAPFRMRTQLLDKRMRLRRVGSIQGTDCKELEPPLDQWCQFIAIHSSQIDYNDRSVHVLLSSAPAIK